ncbi:hypothetical protein JYU34_012220 [Plutella xylostella]|uniref:Partial AB-hydrolase lipase domain-containing protein n=1 Tax=Plutella xylostella TaxID=51655 RepID=A0ABQ7QER6_PLUXY|nr:hypothetical protein JYU34_012220 [Plutella xylostella]
MKTILLVLSVFTCLIQCLSIDENAFPYIFPNVPPVKDLVNSGFEEDAVLDFIALTKKYGYTSEEHEVITEDGYILTIFRISRGKACNRSEPPDPVVMMHGLLKSSDTFVTPGVGLAYTLADSCYDVWCANVRGNRYSREHVKWDPDKDKEFWQFSFHEHGTIDLATTVDYVLNETKAEKNIKGDFFRRYDAGANKNLENYGQEEPLDYDLAKVTAPVVLICSNDDAIATPKDVERLRDELPNVIDMFTLRDPHWGHLDFTDGNDIPLELAPKVLEYLRVARDGR